MRVLHVIDNFAQGGAQRVATSLAEGFLGSAIASFDKKALLAFPERLRDHGIAHHAVDTEADIDRMMADFDICHIHWWNCDINWRLRWESKPYPVVITLHEASVFPHEGQTVVCVGPTQQALQRVPSILIPNGFDLKDFVYPRNYESPWALRIGFASRLDNKLEINAAHMMFKALGEVGVHYTIRVIGDGAHREHYTRAFAELGVTTDFTGIRWDMHEALKDLDIFLYPTKADVLPTVIIEAMASGLPVVAPPVGSIPDMLADGRGYACDWQNMPPILAALAENSKLRSSMGAKARKYALAHWNHESMLSAYRTLYDKRFNAMPSHRKSWGCEPWPKLSVIVPTYRRPGLCYKAVKSLLAQDYEPLEIIVVNDGDNQSDYSLVMGLPVKYVRLEQNVGLSGARNAGVGLAKSDYVGFLDDDDAWQPWFASELMRKIMDDRGDIVYGAGYAAIDDMRQNMNHCYPFDIERLKQTNYITVSAVVMRRVVLECFGGFDVAMHQNGMHGPEDWELWLRLALKGCTFVRCPMAGLIYGVDSPERLTRMAYDSGAMSRGYKYISAKLGVTIG